MAVNYNFKALLLDADLLSNLDILGKASKKQIIWIIEQLSLRVPKSQ